MTDQELLNLKKSIETAKRKQSEAEGKKKALLETLDKKFNCTTVDQAERELSKLQKETDRLEQKRIQKIEKLEKDYDF